MTERLRTRIIAGRGVHPEEVEPLRDAVEAGFREPGSMLSAEHKQLLKEHEIGKSETEKEILSLINEKTNALVRRYGVEPVDLSHEHYHLLPASVFREHFPTTEQGEAIAHFKEKTSISIEKKLQSTRSLQKLHCTKPFISRRIKHCIRTRMRWVKSISHNIEMA
jgi:hypothetical protein